MCCCDNDLPMNINIKLLLEAERFDYNSINAGNLFSFLDNKSTIIFGGYNGSILKYIPNAYTLEYTKENYEKLVTMLPKDRVYNYLGAFTPIKQKFDAVLITDFWFSMKKQWLFQVLREAMRIGNAVYLTYEIIVEGNRLMSVDDEKMVVLESYITELNRKFSVDTYTSHNTVLKILFIHN